MKRIIILVMSMATFSAHAEEATMTDKQWALSVHYGAGDAVGDTVDLGALFTGGVALEYKTNKNLGVKFGFNIGSNSNLLNVEDIIPEVFGIESDKYTFDSTYLALSARTSDSVYVFGSLGAVYVAETIGSRDSLTNINKYSTNLYLEGGAGWDINQSFSMGISYIKANAVFADLTSIQYQLTYKF